MTFLAHSGRGGDAGLAGGAGEADPYGTKRSTGGEPGTEMSGGDGGSGLFSRGVPGLQWYGGYGGAGNGTEGGGSNHVNPAAKLPRRVTVKAARTHRTITVR